MTDEVRVTYPMARWHIADGMYSIKELEEMLEFMRGAEELQRKALELSMKPST